MTWIERAAINAISPRLRNFKWLGDNALASCPICGDSKKNKFKARFYFLQSGDHFNVFCHNCGFSASFSKFLESFDRSAYDRMNVELFALRKQARHAGKRNKQKFTHKYDLHHSKNNHFVISNANILKYFTKLSKLDSNHPARVFCDNRQIPAKTHFRIYYTDNFTLSVNHILPNKLKERQLDRRIVFFLADSDQQVFAVNGRTIDDDDIRYMTIVFNEQFKPRVYGLDNVNKNRPVYVLEGPIDSLFVDNAIAMCGSTINIDDLNKVGLVDRLFVLDNDRRNEQIVSVYQRLLNNGEKVFMWPENIHYKDINEMIVDRYSVNDVKQMIDDNVAHGPTGLLKLASWRRD